MSLPVLLIVIIAIAALIYGAFTKARSVIIAVIIAVIMLGLCLVTIYLALRNFFPIETDKPYIGVAIVNSLIFLSALFVFIKQLYGIWRIIKNKWCFQHD